MCATSLIVVYHNKQKKSIEKEKSMPILTINVQKAKKTPQTKIDKEKIKKNLK